jgi:hypothetical protein
MGKIISDIKQIPGTTEVGRSITRAADAAAARGVLVLGTLATQDGDIGDYATIALVNSAVAAIDSALSSKSDVGHGHSASEIGDSSEVGRALLQAADAVTARSALGLGTLATQSGTFSGTSSGTNTGDVSLGTANGLTLAGQVLSLPTSATPTFATATTGQIVNKDGLGSISLGWLTGEQHSMNVLSGRTLKLGNAASNWPVVFEMAGAEVARFSGAGRLLLGTTTDDGTNRLQVQGTAAVSGNVISTAGDFQCGPSNAFRSTSANTGYFVPGSANNPGVAVASGGSFRVYQGGGSDFFVMTQTGVTSTQTWNSGGTTFTAMKVNVTDTASAAASLLLDLQTGGTSRTSVTKGGEVRADSGNIRLGNIGGSFACIGFRGALGSSNYTIGTLAGSHTYWNTPAGSQHFFQVNQTDVAQISTTGINSNAAITAATTMSPGTYTVATLPTPGTARRIAYASNGRKTSSEGAGAGTGTLVYDDGTAWRRVSDGTTVAA